MGIKRVKGGFKITRPKCVVCGEPPFGDEYACGHQQKKNGDKPVRNTDGKRSS